MRLICSLIFACLILTALKSAAEPMVHYQDSLGQTWNRHILTEKQKDHRTLVLVVDENGRQMQRTVLRQSFTPGEKAQMIKAISLAQLPHLNPQIEKSLTPTNNPIWPIDHQWTEQDEAAYSVWIHQIADVNFLVGGGVDVDCADYAITLRWIYSHDHHLPAGQQLAASGKLFGNWESTTDWDALPTNADWKQDERFKASLRYVLTSTFTHSLFTDLYPVEITPQFVLPGSIFLTLDGTSGHTRTLMVVGDDSNCDDSGGCMIIIWGNEPASENGFITNFVPAKLAQDGGGFLKFRWPELGASGWALHPAETMPGYSLEQYGFTDDGYLATISSRLNLWTSPEARYQVTGDNTAELLIERTDAVNQGYFLCSLVPCSPQDPNYANWSTPLRDQAIVNSIKTFQAAAAQLDPNSDTVTNLNQEYDFPIFNGAPMTVTDILNGQLATKFSSDPTQNFFARWGVTGLDVDDQLAAYTDLIFQVWSEREDTVNQAQTLCFPNGGRTPTCNPADAAVKNLSTARLDQGFRQMHSVFISLFNRASADSQNLVTGNLQSLSTIENLCGDDGQETCSLYDYLFGKVDHWAVMKSNADAPFASRFGF